MRLPLLIAALSGLAACTTGADAPMPALDLPDAYRATPASADAAWPSATWWTGFGSTELNGLIAQARAASPDIEAAAARVRQADAQLVIAGAGLLPSISASGDAAWNRTIARKIGGITGKNAETRTYQLGPAVSWELDLWGRLAATRDAARQSALASRFDQQSVALSTVTAVASTWFQALALQDRLDVANRNLRDAEAIQNAIQARQEVGTASALDVAQQGALVAGIRAQIPALKSQLEQQVIALGVLIGKPPAAIAVRPGTLTTLSLPAVKPGLPSALLARRPDVAAAEARLRAANADITVARAAFFPTVSLSGAAGFQALALGTLFGPGSIFANAAASASQVIFDYGRTAAGVALSRAQYDELAADYRKTVLQAFTDVDTAITAFTFATEQERLLREAVRVAQLAADIAGAQVRAGTSDIVNALQAQTTLFNDLDSLAQVRLARFQALLSLYKAMGGGWASEDGKP